MNIKTIKKLIEINEDFYRDVGSVIWNPLADYYWDGWDAMLKSFEKNNVLDKKLPIKVLDLGCGNGRFLNFLVDRGYKIEKYIGVDISQEMLNIGKAQVLKKQKDIKIDLVKIDLVFEDWATKIEKTANKTEFDLIVSFGLFHHIPSYKIRENIFKQVASLMNKESIFVWTTWRFTEMERLKKRVLSFKSEECKKVLSSKNLSREDLEQGDYILDWVKLKKSYRYSHAFEKKEIDKLHQSFNVLDYFTEDDRKRDRNGYYVLKRNN